MTTPGNPNVVVGQPTLQQQAAAGAGPAANPWAEYGLNPDGTPLTVPAKVADPVAEKASLEQKVLELEAKLARLPEGFEALSKKVGLVDKLVAALKDEAPTGNSPDKQRFSEIWTDLKQVAGHQAPAFEKLISLLESDPTFIDRMQAAQGALMSQHVVSVNQRAHDRVVELAKKAGFKSSNEVEMSELVFPFEQAMTVTINANPELRRAFLSGNTGVVDEVFNRMIKPHVAQRLRDKQAKSQSAFGGVRSVPRGASSAPAPVQDQAPKRDLASPKGKMAFHKQAVERWIGKSASGDE